MFSVFSVLRFLFRGKCFYFPTADHLMWLLSFCFFFMTVLWLLDVTVVFASFSRQCSDRKNCGGAAQNEVSSSLGAVPNPRFGLHPHLSCGTGKQRCTAFCCGCACVLGNQVVVQLTTVFCCCCCCCFHRVKGGGGLQGVGLSVADTLEGRGGGVCCWIRVEIDYDPWLILVPDGVSHRWRLGQGGEG